MSPEDPLDMGNGWECGEELDGELLGSDARSNDPNCREEGRHGVYLCPEADQHSFIRSGPDQRAGGGESKLSGWSLFSSGGLEKWESGLHEVREQDCLLSPATRDLLREL